MLQRPQKAKVVTLRPFDESIAWTVVSKKPIRLCYNNNKVKQHVMLSHQQKELKII